MNSSSKNVCFMSKASFDINWLWHRRLSHLNFKILNHLSLNQLVTGLPDYSFAKQSLCSVCEKGKQTRASFKSKQISSVSSPLQLLHMDRIRPVNVQSLAGKKYTLVIVDEFSRYTSFSEPRVIHLKKSSPLSRRWKHSTTWSFAQSEVIMVLVGPRFRDWNWF